jgi:small-conductance mechanosensitive channel
VFESVQFEEYFNLIINHIKNNLFIVSNLIELIILAVIIAASYFLSLLLNNKIEKLLMRIKALRESKRKRIINKLLFPFLLMIFIWTYFIIATAFSLPSVIINIFGNLVTAWFIVKTITMFFPRNKMFRFLSIIIWIIAALRILNIYEETVNFLDGLAFTSGNLRISVLLITKVIIIFSILFWLSGKISRIVSRRINKSSDLTPSVKVLLNKITKILIYTSAGLFTLSAVGVNLSAFAFLGGAVGVGIGFGLQKIVSNFISGIIILADKSIKPGDIVEIGSVYGWVKNLDTRFASIVTRSGKEYLIPNEDFITKEVINWSYSDDLVRVDAEVGVSYNSDLRLVEKLILESAKEKKRILTSPEPTCILLGFGDSSVNFELHFWISDPRNGIPNIRSEVLFSIWDSFQEHGIEIPFPQRDYHLKSISESVKEDMQKYKRPEERNE